MFFVMVLGKFLLCSLCVRVCRLTVSKAFVMSRAIASVPCGGFFPVESLCYCVVYGV